MGYCMVQNFDMENECEEQFDDKMTNLLQCNTDAK